MIKGDVDGGIDVFLLASVCLCSFILDRFDGHGSKAKLGA
jgi:hypothetical protein